MKHKKGKWIRYGQDGYPNEKDTVYWQCDQCLTTQIGRREKPIDFCPECNADMRTKRMSSRDLISAPWNVRSRENERHEKIHENRKG